ncbi:MAG: right-handed parallel beta-helix repeat-containing protein [bacterium]|nr:right-handed parallel beta-helix repeat-containing protein [bacterium]
MKKLFLIIIFFTIPSDAFAYEPTQTHAGLTEQVVEFYNLQFGNKITNTQKESMIKGAMEEDEPSTRAVNHFYDPVRGMGVASSRSAKDWALGDVELNKYDWNDAIKLYAEGDESGAFVALGHVVHLIEDMGVPDHTRNDQHLPVWEALGGDSPYEDWSALNKNRTSLAGLGKRYMDAGSLARVFNDLGAYFDFLANYSNRNFFSRDTIEGSVYAEPVFTSVLDGYAYAKDNLTGEMVKLAIVKQEKDGSRNKILNTEDNTSILSSYFDRLSLQIIPSGAGVVDLFFKEGEKARAIYQAELRKKKEAETRANTVQAQILSRTGVPGFFTRLTYGFGYLVSDYIIDPVITPAWNSLYSFGSGVVTVGTVSVQEGANGTKIALFGVGAAEVASYNWSKNQIAAIPGAIKTGYEVSKDTVLNSIVFIQQTTKTQPTTTKITTTIPKQPQIQNQQEPQTVFVFEPKVGEAGTNMPKLVFVGTVTGDSSGGGSPTQQVLGTQTSTSGTDEATGKGETAERVGVAVAAPILSASQCAQTLATDGCLLATTTVRFEWTQVEGADHYVVNKNGTIATTTDNALDEIAKDFSDYVFEVVAVGPDGTVSATSTQKVSVATIPVAINEIAWMGTVASATDEWFEIKNNTTHTIDLSQWELNAKDGMPHVKLTGTIAPRGYLVFERIDDTTVSDVAAHQIYTGALGNSGEQLNLSYASTTFDQTPEGAWAGGTNSTTSRKTMERYSSREDGSNPENWGTNLGDTRTDDEMFECSQKAKIEYIYSTGCYREGLSRNGLDADDNLIGGTPGMQNSISMLINKGKNITSDFTLTSDEERYVATTTISVSATSTLTIEPGVTISFYRQRCNCREYYRYDGALVVNGTLDARGTVEEPIIFNSFLGNPTGRLILRGGTGTSTLEYVQLEDVGEIIIDHARIDVRNSDFIHTDGGLAAISHGQIFVENTNFNNLINSAFYANDFSTIDAFSIAIDNSEKGNAFDAFNNSVITVASTTVNNLGRGDGFGSYNNSTVTVSGAVINNICGDAFGADNNSVLTVSSSTVKNVCWGDAFGAYGNSILTIASTTIDGIEGNGIGAYDSILNVSDTTIRNVEDYGISLDDATSTITNVVIENGPNDGIEIYGGVTTIASTTVKGFNKSEVYYDEEGSLIWSDYGSGITVEKPLEPVSITNSEITGNTVGISVDTSESVILSNTSVHDNGQNIAVCEFRPDCALE